MDHRTRTGFAPGTTDNHNHDDTGPGLGKQVWPASSHHLRPAALGDQFIPDVVFCAHAEGRARTVDHINSAACSRITETRYRNLHPPCHLRVEPVFFAASSGIARAVYFCLIASLVHVHQYP